MKKRIALLGLVAAVISTMTMITVTADDLSDAQNQKEYIDGKLNSLTKQKQDEKNKLNSVINEKNNLANEQAKAQNDLTKAAADLKMAEEELKSMDSSLKEAEAKYNSQIELFKTRVRIMYQNSDSSYLETIAKSKNMSDFLSKMQIIATIAKRDKVLADTLETAKKDVEVKKQLQEEENKKLLASVDDKKRTVNNLQTSRALKENEERSISAKIKSYEQQENKLLEEAERLTGLINNLKLRRKGAYVEGQMVWPAPGYGGVSSLFGNRLHPILKTYRMHTGIDISAPASAAIVSANKGTVILAGWQDGYGNTVIVDHGGDIVTLYAHCSKLLVSVGQEVEAGETIAKVGSTGLSTGPHLHFEVRIGGSVVDPLEYVGQ